MLATFLKLLIGVRDAHTKSRALKMATVLVLFRVILKEKCLTS